MSRICMTCGSERCGNHAACARRHEAAAKWRAQFAEVWVAIGAAAEVVARVRAEITDAPIPDIMAAWFRAEEERRTRDMMAALFFGGIGRRRR